MSTDKKPFEIPATIDLNPKGGQPDASIIWLHGLGADANDFLPIEEEFRSKYKINIRFVFPQAPIRPITINRGAEMRAWYDIVELNLGRKEDIHGIRHSAELIHLLIERELSLNIQSDRILLGGFSQGGAISLYAGLRYPKKLGGIIALSCYLLGAENFEKERHSANHNTSVFLAHGLFDPVVPLMLGEHAKTVLLSSGYPVEWHQYPLPHTVNQQEIDDIGQYIENLLLKNGRL